MKIDEKKCPSCAEVIKKQALACRHCGYQFSPTEIAAQKRADNRLNIATAIVVLLIIGALLTMCSGEPEQGPTSIVAADTAVTNVEVSFMNVFVTVDLSEAASGSNAIAEAGIVAEKIGKAVKAGAKELTSDSKFVVLLVTVPTVDRLGREDRTRILQLRYAVADLKAANYENLGAAGTLSAAQEATISHNLGAQAVKAFCEDRTFFAGSRGFCSLVS